MLQPAGTVGPRQSWRTDLSSASQRWHGTSLKLWASLAILAPNEAQNLSWCVFNLPNMYLNNGICYRYILLQHLHLISVFFNLIIVFVFIPESVPYFQICVATTEGGSDRGRLRQRAAATEGGSDRGRQRQRTAATEGGSDRGPERQRTAATGRQRQRAAATENSSDRGWQRQRAPATDSSDRGWQRQRRQ